MSEEEDILNLIDQSETRAFERMLTQLERVVDVGDRIAMQSIVREAAKRNEEVEVPGQEYGLKSDPTQVAQ